MTAAQTFKVPAWDDPNCRETQMVVIERDASGKPTVWCDPEIADLIRALNAGGVPTEASCSGHGEKPGWIALRDGRQLAIVPDLESFKRFIGEARAALTDEQVEPLFREVKAMPVTGEKDEWFWFAWGVEMGERFHGIRASSPSVQNMGEGETGKDGVAVPRAADPLEGAPEVCEGCGAIEARNESHHHACPRGTEASARKRLDAVPDRLRGLVQLQGHDEHPERCGKCRKPWLCEQKGCMDKAASEPAPGVGGTDGR